MALSRTILGLCAALLATYAVRRFLVYQRRRAMAAQFGCQPVPKWPSTDPLGRDYDRVMREGWRTGKPNKTRMDQFHTVGSGTYQVSSSDDIAFHTNEPLNHQAVVSTKRDDWARAARRAAWRLDGTSSILNSDGAEWRHTRDLVTPLFQRAELRDIEFFEKFVNRFIEKIPRDGSTIDLDPWIRKLFEDSTSEFCFGESIDSLRDESGFADRYIAAVDRAVAGAGKRLRPTGWRTKLWNMVTDPWDKQWTADCKVAHDYVDGCIARHRSREKVAPHRRYVLIEGMSDVFPDALALRSQLFAIYRTGREVSAMAFANTLFMLARNPHVWSKLRSQAVALRPDEITFERLNSMALFKYTVQETLRLHTPVPIVRRTAVRDTVLPVGGGPDGTAPCLAPKGTVLWVDRHPKFIDPEVWGDDVDDFRPERFEDRRSLGWEFRPFSGGPRVCPANQQVISQVVYLLVRMTREFEMIENRDPCIEFVEGVQMVLVSKNGCKVALHPARN